MMCFVIQHIQRIGKIDRIHTTSQDIHPVATQFADIYYERDSEPLKFVIEADGNPEPAMVFIRGEFKMTIYGRENNFKTLLKLGGAAVYEISFDSRDETYKLNDKIGFYMKHGSSSSKKA